MNSENGDPYLLYGEGNVKHLLIYEAAASLPAKQLSPMCYLCSALQSNSYIALIVIYLLCISFYNKAANKATHM